MGENCIGGRNIQFPPNERKNSTIKASTRCSNRSIGRRKVSDCILERVFHPTIVLCVCCQACRGVPRPSPEKGVTRRRQREARSKGEKGADGKEPQQQPGKGGKHQRKIMMLSCRVVRHLSLAPHVRGLHDISCSLTAQDEASRGLHPIFSSRSRRRKDPFGTYRPHNRKKKGEEGGENLAVASFNQLR